MTSGRRHIAGAIILLTCLSGQVYAEDPSIEFQDVAVPAETIGCMEILFTGNDAGTDESLANSDQQLLEAARNLKIAKIGIPFILGLSAGQVKDVYPLKLNYCIPVSSSPETQTLIYKTLPRRTVSLGFCPSPRRDACQAALLKVIGMGTDAATVESAPLIRTGVWMEEAAPDRQQMIESVFGLRKTFDQPSGTSPGGDGVLTIGNSTKRPLGQLSTAPPKVSGEQVKDSNGFVFALSRRAETR